MCVIAAHLLIPKTKTWFSVFILPAPSLDIELAYFILGHLQQLRLSDLFANHYITLLHAWQMQLQLTLRNARQGFVWVFFQWESKSDLRQLRLGVVMTASGRLFQPATTLSTPYGCGWDLQLGLSFIDLAVKVFKIFLLLPHVSDVAKVILGLMTLDVIGNISEISSSAVLEGWEFPIRICSWYDLAALNYSVAHFRHPCAVSCGGTAWQSSHTPAPSLWWRCLPQDSWKWAVNCHVGLWLCCKLPCQLVVDRMSKSSFCPTCYALVLCKVGRSKRMVWLGDFFSDLSWESFYSPLLPPIRSMLLANHKLHMGLPPMDMVVW